MKTNKDALEFVNQWARDHGCRNKLFGLSMEGTVILGKILPDHEWFPKGLLSSIEEEAIDKWIQMGGEIIKNKEEVV